jgi:regulator of protease activity HflC (stomatin/prohibitin superfamily)
MNIGSLLEGLAALAWVGALATLGIVVFNAARGRRIMIGAPVIVGAVVLALLLTAVASGLVFIDPELRGVVISALAQGGYRPDALGPGLHWIIPFAERVQTYAISRQTYTMSSSPAEGQITGNDSVVARTKDGQQIFIDASIIYEVDPQKIVQLNILWQDRFEQGLVRPTARGTIRDAASQYGVEEIVSTKRTELESLITDQLAATLAANDLILVNFVLRDITFTPEYATAVEQKQIAQQQVEQQTFVVDVKKQEADQARVTAQGLADAVVISAQGEAQATVLNAQANAQELTLTGDALKGRTDALTFRYIDKLAPNVQVMYLPSGGNYLIPLPTPNNALPTLPTVLTDTTTVTTTSPITTTTVITK